MRPALHPLGILLAHTLPVLALIAMYASMLQVVHPLLEPEHIAAWRVMAVVLGGAVTVSTIYAALRWWQRLPVQALYAALVFLAYVPLLFFVGNSIDALFPWSIPRWMLPEDAELYAFRLLCIPLAHALFVLVALSLPAGDRGRPLRDLLTAAAIPIGVYLFVQVVRPFRGASDFEEHAWIVVMVCLVTGFLFLLIRGVMAMALRVSTTSALTQVMRVLVALVFPLLGLMVNNGDLRLSFSEGRGAFGDLSHPAFYIIAVLNAAVVLWPSSAQPRIRLIQFLLRATGFSYVLYFFVLFLPLLPLSIVAILAVGLGFLLLAPVLLFTVQAMLLTQDVRFLAAHRPKAAIAGLFAAALLVLPAAITVRYLHHRTVLHDALHHVYESDPTLPTLPLDAEALRTVLRQVDANASRRRGWGGSSTPFLTPWYNRIVLDNLTLSQARSDVLRQVFLNEPPNELTNSRRRMPSNAHTRIDRATVSSRYDEAQGAWRSWIHLAVTNTGTAQEEFITAFNLPDGAWICDHYLMIGADTAQGILAEKKSAQWVYSNIVSRLQDPSMLRYTGPGRVELRVFPVEAENERRTGFEVLHKEACDLALGNDTLRLGDAARDLSWALIPSPGGGVGYIPSPVKKSLPLVQRAPHFHFIVDGSEAHRAIRQQVVQRLRTYASPARMPDVRATLHVADAYGLSLPFGDEALAAYEHHAGHGGFFTDRIVRKVLADACLYPKSEAPVIVIVPSAPASQLSALGIFLDDLTDIAECLPEGDRFLVLGDDGAVTVRAFSDPAFQLSYDNADLSMPFVRAWPDAREPKYYLRDDPGGAIILDALHMDGTQPTTTRDWSQALDQEGRCRALRMRTQIPETSWRSVVRGSFGAQVMLPVTSWMCVENEAQRNALLRKQEEVLQGNPQLDAMNEELNSMSEPGIIWLLPVLLIVLLWRRRM